MFYDKSCFDEVVDNEDWSDSTCCVPGAWGLAKTRDIDYPVE